MSKSEIAAERRRELTGSVKEKYAAVAGAPSGRFPYPVGRESALGLGYEREWLDATPFDSLEGFVGVGNPFSIWRPSAGDAVLDVGCGCGLDTYVASHLAGSAGKAVGIDLTPAMLDRARTGLSLWQGGSVEFLEGSAEELPFGDGSFDAVLSNGVINLVPDKDCAYREIFRVLRAGAVLALADLLVVETIPDDVLADMDAWST